MTTHQVTVLTAEASDYAALVPGSLPEHVVLNCVTDDPAKVDLENTTILLADPDLAAQVIPHMPKLVWCQSIWAGNRPLLALDRKDYILTPAKGVFDVQMREFVFTYLFHYCRNVDGYREAQQQKDWFQPSFGRLCGKTLGITGAGSIAKALLPVAASLGLKVIGVSRSGEHQDGYEQIFTWDTMDEFASRCDYVLNLMPDTPQSANLLNKDFFDLLPNHCVLINAGRGTAIVDEDLIAALDADQLQAAVLDVFREEPLPASHPFWEHPKIRITQHTAAESRPEDIAALFVDNLELLLEGKALPHQFDFSKGY